MQQYFVTIVKLESFIDSNLTEIKSNLILKQNFMNLLIENRTDLVKKLGLICKNTKIPSLMLMDSANGYSPDDFIPYFSHQSQNQTNSQLNTLSNSKISQSSLIQPFNMINTQDLSGNISTKNIKKHSGKKAKTKKNQIGQLKKNLLTLSDRKSNNIKRIN